MDPNTVSLLRDVSRSFYLTLRILPTGVRDQIGLAYLAARTSDTIADTTLVPAEFRIGALERFRDRFAGNEKTPLDLDRFLTGIPESAEKLLLRRVEETCAAISSFPSWDREQIREVLRIILSGQLLDLQRFKTASRTAIVPLPSAQDLEDYTYRVAGCVGDFWTRLCCRHLYRPGETDEPALRMKGIEFGKGLQLINVLRDFPTDLEAGRCYLPLDELQKAGVSLPELAAPAGRRLASPVYRRYLDQAGRYLNTGWEYTNSLPRRSMRVRLACAWPILIGMKTLAKLHRSLDLVFEGNRVKISKSEVRDVLLRSIFFYPFPGVWRRLFKVPEA